MAEETSDSKKPLLLSDCSLVQPGESVLKVTTKNLPLKLGNEELLHAGIEVENDSD